MEGLYFRGPDILRRIRLKGIDTDLLVRQGAGHYTHNHDAFHSKGSDAPCYGYGNWLLLWTARIISQGLSSPFNGKKQQQAVPLLKECWLSGQLTHFLPDSWEVQQVRLQKDTSKVQLFQELCGFLVRPLTNMTGQVTRLWTQLESATLWEKFELLCAQYMRQYARQLHDDTTVPASTVEAPQASTEDPRLKMC